MKRFTVSAACISVALLLQVAPNGRAEQTADNEAKRAREETEAKAKEIAVKKWKRMFGDNIDFAEEGLYGCMSYVHPQPDALMVDLDDKKVIGASPGYGVTLTLKPAFRFDAKKHEPDKYYIRKRDDEPDLLYYEWRKPKYTFRMYESGDGMLLRIKPKGHDPRKPLAAKALATALYDVFNMKYASADKLAEAFNLPKTLSSGTFFTNADMVNVHIVRGWERHVIGFLSKEDICVICFFSTDSRMALLFDFHPNWLDGCIFEKDGKTPVNPIKEDK